MLHRQTPLSRQVVARILEGNKISWTPRKADGFYEFNGRATLDRLLSGLIHTRGDQSAWGRHRFPVYSGHMGDAFSTRRRNDRR